jgi:hypothetical protein
MSLPALFEPFVEGSPVCTMFRALLENVFSDDAIDLLFRMHARKQRERELLFSTVASLAGSVALRQHKSLRAAYVSRRDEIGVSAKALYEKTAGVEPQVCEALVAETSDKLAAIAESFRPLADPLPGYETLVVDGNHLPASQRRLKRVREGGVAGLPGQALVLLDARRNLARRVVVEQDAHANERTLLPPLLAYARSGQCWIADRNLGPLAFLEGLSAADARFVMREHGGGFACRPVGERIATGRIDSGETFEQPIEISRNDGSSWRLRRIAIELDEPTRDGDREVLLLSDLPPEIVASRIGLAYGDRWRIENVFQDAATTFEGEVERLACPGAALLTFCMALLASNVLSVMKAAVADAHAEAMEDELRRRREKAEAAEREREKTARRNRTTPDATRTPRVFPIKLSTYYLADEIDRVYDGMLLAIPPPRWRTAFATLDVDAMARILFDLATRVRWERYLTNPWTPKPRKRPARPRNPPHLHASVRRLLDSDEKR